MVSSWGGSSMTVMSLSAFEQTEQFVSADMFGANAVYSKTENGVPTAAYESAAKAFGVSNIRFGGGQADLDPAKANAAGERPIDGESAINIVDMPDNTLRSELVDFLDWCVAQFAAGAPVQTTLIIPTKHLDTDAYAAFADEIDVFVQAVMQDYSSVIAAFQIGNEYWEMGETDYGIKASAAASAIANGLDAVGIAEPEQPDILVQMATAGNEGSEFPATPGIADFLVRNEAANKQIIAQLSQEAREAIDGVTEHYYYNRSDHEFEPTQMAVRNINYDYEVWAETFGNDLDLYVTEWNVRTSATEQQGLVAASTLIKQFENMIEIGVDGAHIWTFDYHARTALTLPSDSGALLDDQGRVTNSPQGAVFDLMSEALVGKERITTSFTDSLPGIEISSYASAEEMVFYISSRSFDQTTFTLDLSSALTTFGPVQAVQLAIDPNSSNGQQWQRGVDAQSVLIEGEPYFYNEHDVDVILTDMTFDDADQIDLSLDPFEVVELTVALVPQEPTQPISKIVPNLGETAIVDRTYVGTGNDDQIFLTSDFTRIEGGSGLDRLTLDALRAEVGISFGGTNGPVLFLPGTAQQVVVTDVERLIFEDGTLALDIDGHSGQAYRLYQSSLDRAPDPDGLAFWINQLDAGTSLTTAAAAFLASAEFTESHDTLSDEAFIELMYSIVLDRSADLEGFAFWQAQLDNQLSRAAILVAFSESPENKQSVAAAVNDGIWFA